MYPHPTSAVARQLSESECTCRARFVPWVLLSSKVTNKQLCAFEFGTAANSVRELDHNGQHSFMYARRFRAGQNLTIWSLGDCITTLEPPSEHVAAAVAERRCSALPVILGFIIAAWIFFFVAALAKSRGNAARFAVAQAGAIAGVAALGALGYTARPCIRA